MTYFVYTNLGYDGNVLTAYKTKEDAEKGLADDRKQGNLAIMIVGEVVQDSVREDERKLFSEVFDV